MTQPIKVTRRQVAWFRFQRSGLAAPFASAEIAARRLIGIQAQMLPAAGLALHNRLDNFSWNELEHLLYRQRTLLKLWGQRNTLHLYPSQEWPLLHAAFESLGSWFERGYLKRGGDPALFQRTLQRAKDELQQATVLRREDVRGLEMDLDSALGTSSWSGLCMSLVRAGVACHAEPGERNESRYCHRERWLPDLPWTPPAAAEADERLTRRYLAAYGPASPQDLGYFRGFNATHARAVLGAMKSELAPVEFDGGSGSLLRTDLESLNIQPPPRSRWPVKLLYRFDPLLLGLREKSWLVADQYYKKVWRPAGHVEGTLLVGGRIEGVWRYDRTARGLIVTFEPFRTLAKTVQRELTRQGRKVARFFQQPLVEVRYSEPG